jgi:hypothetical protein
MSDDKYKKRQATQEEDTARHNRIIERIAERIYVERYEAQIEKLKSENERLRALLFGQCEGGGI